MSEPTVAALIVTHNSAADLPGCFEALEALTHRPLEIVVVDCASQDDTCTVLASQTLRVPYRFVLLDDNRGFTGGMNAALGETSAPWIFSVNPDARPQPDYVSKLLDRAAAHPALKVGAATGRLVRPVGPTGQRLLDACGMRLTRSWRHLDRGSGEVDVGQYSTPERVFGATGAASLFRREALDDVAVAGEIFDERFHSFREDAELAFRLRERGWEILYEPTAVAEHCRFNLPERRRTMPAAVNYHSLKNRYLLRIYHQTAGNFMRTLLPTLARDLAALGYALLLERTSLLAYGWLWRHRRELWQRRREIQGRQTAAARAVERWFAVEGLPSQP